MLTTREIRRRKKRDRRLARHEIVSWFAESLTKDERDLEAERLELEELNELFMMFEEMDWERAYRKQLDEEFKTRVYRECAEQDDYDDMTWWLRGGW